MSIIEHSKSLIRSLCQYCGFDFVRHDLSRSADIKRSHLLSRHSISLVLDVGANVGQYAKRLRRNGYTGRIFSFEPLESAYAKLCDATRRDSDWKCANIALGSHQETARMFVSKNSASSSLLPMCDTTLRNAPEAAYVAQQEIKVVTLDSQLGSISQALDQIYLKIDVQGWELEVLMGSTASLPNISAIELELSVVPLYQGQPLYLQIMNYLAELGFELFSIDPCFADRTTGQLLQVDALYCRKGLKS